MAHFVDPINTEPNQLARLIRRTEDNLSDCVKDQVHWQTDQSSGEGYYILNPRTNIYTPLEFIDNYWYRLRVYIGQAYTSRDTQIELYHNNTGYWRVTDWQHLNQRLLAQQTAATAVDILYQRDLVYYERLKEEAEERSQRHFRLPTLTIDTAGTLSLVGDPTISPFIAASPQATNSPLFTEPQATSDHKESDSTEEPPSSTTDKPSPEQVGQEEPVLEAQLEHTLNVQEEEPVAPPPIAQPAPQSIVPVQIMATPAA